jgi:hypothetical protein
MPIYKNIYFHQFTCICMHIIPCDMHVKASLHSKYVRDRQLMMYCQDRDLHHHNQ